MTEDCNITFIFLKSVNQPYFGDFVIFNNGLFCYKGKEDENQ